MRNSWRNDERDRHDTKPFLRGAKPKMDAHLIHPQRAPRQAQSAGKAGISEGARPERKGDSYA